MRYAIIENGFVVNNVVWDGFGDTFTGLDAIEIKGSFSPCIGDAYINDTIIPKPTDGYDYTFNEDSLTWVISTDGAKDKEKSSAEENIQNAMSEYDVASDKITALQQQLDDGDYTGADAETQLMGIKSKWTAYRKNLRAYIAADNWLATLPTPPSVQ